MANNDTPAAAPSIDDIRSQLDELPPISRDSSVEERREFRQKADELSQQAADLRQKEIDNDKRFDSDEKQILKLYEQGKQNYAIAKEVYKFVNQDTVGKVILTIRKAYADDFNEVEDVNSTKGYTGV